MALITAVPSARAASPTAPQGDCASYSGIVPDSCGYSGPHQDAAFISAKYEHRVQIVNGVPVVSPSPVVPMAYPASKVLPTSAVASFLEPRDSGYDMKTPTHQQYADASFENFCAPGAVAVAMQYWLPSTSSPYTPTTYPYESTGFSTAWSTTYWGPSSTARSYILYIGTKLHYPGGPTGIEWYGAYPTAGTYVSDEVNALNWEMSLHSTSYWLNYHYTQRGSTTQAQFESDLKYDLSLNVPVLALVTTADLADWNWTASHSVAVIGYNDTSGTYTYVDTATVDAGKRTNGGYKTVPKAQLWSAIRDLNLGWIF